MPTATRSLTRWALQRLSLRRAMTHVLRRSDYGLVWNWEARSFHNARISVCGTPDMDEYDRSGQATAADVAALAQVGTGDVVLEIGCGTGRVGRHLAPRCARWIGSDVSTQMIKHARRELGDRPNVSFHHLSGRGLDGLDTASIQVVYCTGVFMHLDEWDRYTYVSDAMRVLTPGGRLYIDNFSITTPDGWKLFDEIRTLPAADRPLNVSKTSTPDELRTYVERAGFVDVAVRAGDLWVTVTARKP